METQTPHPLSLRTRDDARAALARAFEEAAVMPGTLLPYEILTELTDAAGRIVDEVLAYEGEHPLTGEGAGPALYIVEHSIDATALGLSIGRRLVPEDSLPELGTGLFLQDIGKLALPPSLVHKPGPLAPDEWELMMQHPRLGLEFLRDDTISARSKSIVRSHHERWDGSGYPSALIGEEIPLFARIAAVADVFGAVTSERFYAQALPRQEGVELIRAGSGSAFDPAVVDAFLGVARG
ncbi:MAG TPA: HD domain-containing phosphohydrolase [Thermoleophilaceae bacterium]|nr:HD domain-containing phosphohydrolase [Thermoleophilaceae bacterium]